MLRSLVVLALFVLYWGAVSAAPLGRELKLSTAVRKRAFLTSDPSNPTAASIAGAGPYYRRDTPRFQGALTPTVNILILRNERSKKWYMINSDTEAVLCELGLPAWASPSFMPGSCDGPNGKLSWKMKSGDISCILVRDESSTSNAWMEVAYLGLSHDELISENGRYCLVENSSHGYSYDIFRFSDSGAGSVVAKCQINDQSKTVSDCNGLWKTKGGSGQFNVPLPLTSSPLAVFAASQQSSTTAELAKMMAFGTAGFLVGAAAIFVKNGISQQHTYDVV